MQVEKILVQFPQLGSNYLITLETVNNQDEMIVEVELSDLSTDNYIELEKVRKAISRRLKDEILVTPKVKLVKKGSLPQSEGKAVRVKDLRFRAPGAERSADMVRLALPAEGHALCRPCKVAQMRFQGRGNYLLQTENGKTDMCTRHRRSGRAYPPMCRPPHGLALPAQHTGGRKLPFPAGKA